MKNISVSKIVGMLDKPALMYWAVNCTVDSMREKLDYLGMDAMGGKIDAPGILKALSEHLPVAKDASRTIANRSKQVGKAVHEQIGLRVFEREHIPVPADEQVKNCLMAFEDFCEETGVMPSLHADTIWYEAPISKELTLKDGSAPIAKITGRIDWVFKSGPERWIVDIKTGSGIYPEMGYQLGGYWVMYGDPEAKIAFLRFDKEGGGYELREFTPEAEAAKFRALRDAYVTINL